jgi:hypothetical protein
LFKVAEHVVEFEAAEDFLDVLGEAGDAVLEVALEVGGVVEDGVVVQRADVVEGVAGGSAEGVVAVFKALGGEPGVQFKNFLLGWFQRIVEAAEGR